MLERVLEDTKLYIVVCNKISEPKDALEQLEYFIRNKEIKK
jgi:hypothetical protein